ncbi:MAG: VRR-NUC domain-containing protein [Candidatus Methanomethylicaceae archaeon]
MRGKRRDKLHREVKRFLESNGVPVLDLADFGGGVPDLLVFWKGRCAFIELKTPTARARILETQRRFWEQWRGCPIYVCFTLQDVAEVVQSLRRKSVCKGRLVNRVKDEG